MFNKMRSVLFIMLCSHGLAFLFYHLSAGDFDLVAKFIHIAAISVGFCLGYYTGCRDRKRVKGSL